MSLPRPNYDAANDPILKEFYAFWHQPLKDVIFKFIEEKLEMDRRLVRMRIQFCANSEINTLEEVVKQLEIADAKEEKHTTHRKQVILSECYQAIPGENNKQIAECYFNEAKKSGYRFPSKPQPPMTPRTSLLTREELDEMQKIWEKEAKRGNPEALALLAGSIVDDKNKRYKSYVKAASHYLTKEKLAGLVLKAQRAFSQPKLKERFSEEKVPAVSIRTEAEVEEASLRAYSAWLWYQPNSPRTERQNDPEYQKRFAK